MYSLLRVLARFTAFKITTFSDWILSILPVNLHSKMFFGKSTLNGTDGNHWTVHLMMPIYSNIINLCHCDRLIWSNRIYNRQNQQIFHFKNKVLEKLSRPGSICSGRRTDYVLVWDPSSDGCRSGEKAGRRWWGEGLEQELVRNMWIHIAFCRKYLNSHCPLQ